MVLYHPDQRLTARAPELPADPESPAPTRTPLPPTEPDGPRSRLPRQVPRLALITAAAAGGAALALGVAGMTWAFPSVPGSCDRDDVMVSVVAGAPRAGQGAAQVQYTARSGRSCTLTGSQPVSLVSAAGVVMVTDDSITAHPVTVSRGHPAHQTLRWNLSADPGHRVEPTALLASTSGWSGNPVRWAWRFGPISTAAGNNAVRVGLVHPGPALPVAADTAGVPEG